MRVLLIDFNPFMPPVTPISLGNLGAVLTAAGHEVRVLTLGSNSRFSPQGLASYLEDYGPRLLGFGAYQRNIFQIRALARMAKEVLRSAVVVLGGPQATFLPDAGLCAMPEIDYLSRGEGEQVIRRIAEATESNEPTPVAGATLRTRAGECVTLDAEDAPRDLDEYPSPWATEVLDPSLLEESILLTSRGCPFRCTFCYTPAAFGQEIRSHSIGRVLSDIELVAKKGTGRLWFADPNFSYSRKRVVAILEGILARNLAVSMWIETRADMLTPELIELMKRAGVHTVAMGLESASPNVYPQLNKRIEPEAIGEAARSALTSGLDVELFSQYALPNETRDDALMTLQFVLGCGVKVRGNSNAQQMQIYHGSEVGADPCAHGIRPFRSDEERSPYLAIGTDFETQWMTRSEIGHVRDAWLAESLDGGKRVVA